MTRKYITRSGLLEDVELFQHFRQQTRVVLKNHFEGIDEPLRETIRLLNEIPGVVTRFCCTGHPDRDLTGAFYISMVIHIQEALEAISNIVYQANKAIFESEEDNELYSIEQFRLSMHEMLVDEYKGETIGYPVVTITSFSEFLETEHAAILEKAVKVEVDRVIEALLEGVL